ncbi:MAG: DEAD/DEAH box helicase family protein [Ignavibacteriae bacterium]|nr:DEAD/DEAH box helicase family protein [Ignavibacteriota bacterium]
MKQIDKLIINSPYSEPTHYWSYDRETRSFELKEGRRPAGYVVATPNSQSFDDPGIFIELPLVNAIRPRIKAWREAGYPGVTGMTKRLLEHWYNLEERSYRRFFFCQLEAIETLIWLTEAPDSEKVGIEIPSDGGEFRRLCSKMATGSGKTIVMGMLIAWQILNKVTYPQDTRFSKHILIVAPGLTVKSRLQVLQPSAIGNYYEEFNIVPQALREKLRQGMVLIHNWHTLNWETEEKLAKKKSVDKRGVKSDEAYVREVLEDMANARNILVINDEAHHAWRVPAESKIRGVKKEEIEEATKWIGGLDRIHKARGILSCFDFSATPFAPSGKQSTEEALFGWIVNDFGLNDAIESGLVKTPRVVVRDDGVPDAHTYKSKLYHIYEHVKDDLNRKAEAHEPLPQLVMNAYYLLGRDWLDTLRKWTDESAATPPVMITVTNTTDTAARIKHAFDKKKIMIEELCISDKILHIDSKVLDLAESKQEVVAVEESETDDEQNDEPKRRMTKEEKAEQLRKMVDTIGQVGKPGEQIQEVISVGMLSEGWDAKTVTHIMGLRAFSSQLLCEQVVGRGLRRTSYEVNAKTGFFDAEYVNIFGVPFTFLPHEKQDGPPPPPPSPKTKIEPDPKKKRFEITWPNIIRIDHVYRPELSLDMSKIKPLILNAYETTTLAELAPIVEGKPDFSKLSTIDLEELGKKFRLQRITFETARDVFEQTSPTWKGNKEYLLAQVIHLVEKFLSANGIQIEPPLFYQDDLKRRVLLALNMPKIVQHIWEAIRFENTESIIPIFDSERPIRSTSDMLPWYTGRPCEHTLKSHINMCVYDSTWEASEAFQLDHNNHVYAWVKNDHIGFEIYYIYQGVVHKYRPDFIIRLTNGKHLILETKGQDTEQDKTKRAFLDEWVKAVNHHGTFGEWSWAVSKNPKDVAGIIESEA